jgi:hypothetical protein
MGDLKQIVEQHERATLQEQGAGDVLRVVRREKQEAARCLRELVLPGESYRGLVSRDGGIDLVTIHRSAFDEITIHREPVGWLVAQGQPVPPYLTPAEAVTALDTALADGGD